MSYDLSILGWKAFQDLCCAVAAEVLQRPVQTFLGSKDGGRDGAFIGTWNGTDGTHAKSTIQCKFMSKQGATLTLSGLKNELSKAAKLVQQGLAEDYVILTNAGVSGESDHDICAAFRDQGVKTSRVFGGDWIVEQLKASPRLRMLVPRVYGIGDLSHIITGHAYTQAKAILDNMGSDLGCFVPTAAYREAVSSLNKYSFVILLGDPASGKSTIAALLALGALDDGCCGALRISNPDQLHLWHPGEKQVLWVDDAFGSNQFDVARMSRWNAELGMLRSAVESGTRIIFTSRNYIWSAARPQLKLNEFPLFSESQVVVNVQDLTKSERAQILYNHVRRKQPLSVRRRLKPFLASVAANANFLPETARRLGDPLFTSKLVVTQERLQRLVDNPVEFLCEVLEQLDEASRAAIALIFLHPAIGVPSPVPSTEALDTVTRLMGVKPASISQALQHLNDSLTRLVPHEEGERWVFRHPTVTDAFATIVARSPEMVELYVKGARLERLIREVVCSQKKIAGAEVRVPAVLYSAVQKRLSNLPIDESLKVFLGQRCDRTFLTSVVQIRPDLLQWAEETDLPYISQGSWLLLAALRSSNLLSETRRREIVEKLTDYALHWVETELLEDEVLQSFFTTEEFSAFTRAFHDRWIVDLDDAFNTFSCCYSSEDEIGLYTSFKENMERAERFYGGDENVESFASLYQQIDDRLTELEEQQPQSDSFAWDPPKPAEGSKNTASIFDDIDAA